jgi:hypothetical protein
MSNNAPADREIAAEDSIRVVCRFRPLNHSEEKAGSKFIVKFPSGGEENGLSLGVSNKLSILMSPMHDYEQSVCQVVNCLHCTYSEITLD